MILGYLLLILVPVAAIAYIVWDHKRKIAERDAASAGKLQEILGTVAQQQRGPGAPVVSPAAGAPLAPPPAAPLYASRERVLTPPQTLLYYLLKTGLPDHVVFARVPLACVVEAGAGLSPLAREGEMRRLATLIVDFIVADRNMKPVAVIEIALPDQGSAAQADRDSARSRLAAAGVRYLEFDAAQLPRNDAIRTLIVGDSPSADSARAAAAGA
jgi:hypothetical protein